VSQRRSISFYGVPEKDQMVFRSLLALLDRQVFDSWTFSESDAADLAIVDNDLPASEALLRRAQSQVRLISLCSAHAQNGQINFGKPFRAKAIIACLNASSKILIQMPAAAAKSVTESAESLARSIVPAPLNNRLPSNPQQAQRPITGPAKSASPTTKSLSAAGEIYLDNRLNPSGQFRLAHWPELRNDQLDEFRIACFLCANTATIDTICAHTKSLRKSVVICINAWFTDGVLDYFDPLSYAEAAGASSVQPSALNLAMELRRSFGFGQ
jgi:hypothetical protein